MTPSGLAPKYWCSSRMYNPQDECESTTQPAGELENDADRSRTDQNDSSSIVSPAELPTPQEPKVEPAPDFQHEVKVRLEKPLELSASETHPADNCDTSLDLSARDSELCLSTARCCQSVRHSSCERHHGSAEGRVYTAETGRCDSRQAKIASRVRLRKTEDSDHNHSSNDETWCVEAAERLALDVCAQADLREALVAASNDGGCHYAIPPPSYKYIPGLPNVEAIQWLPRTDPWRTRAPLTQYDSLYVGNACQKNTALQPIVGTYIRCALSASLAAWRARCARLEGDCRVLQCALTRAADTAHRYGRRGGRGARDAPGERGTVACCSARSPARRIRRTGTDDAGGGGKRCARREGTVACCSARSPARRIRRTGTDDAGGGGQEMRPARGGLSRAAVRAHPRGGYGAQVRTTRGAGGKRCARGGGLSRAAVRAHPRGGYGAQVRTTRGAGGKRCARREGDCRVLQCALTRAADTAHRYGRRGGRGARDAPGRGDCRVLQCALTRAADTAHRLSCACAVQESAMVCVCVALRAADRALETYDVLLALAETAHGTHDERQSAELVAKQLLARLDAEQTLASIGEPLLSPGPWLQHDTQARAESEWTAECESRLREHAARLKSDTVALRNQGHAPALFSYHGNTIRETERAHSIHRENPVMSSVGDDEPPDRGGTPLPPNFSADLNYVPRATVKPGSKRPANIPSEPDDVSKKTTSPSASKQHTFVRPGFENGSDLKYSEIDNYKLPTIQCHKCCRFGHVKDQCRSNPRCAKCAQNHATSDCTVPDSDVTCLYCSGPHTATDNRCPEFSRQKSIKTVMSIENIGYVEAARRFRPVRTSYADKARQNFSPDFQQTPHSQIVDSQSPPGSPTQSYKKTVYIERRPRPPPSKSYDAQAHQAFTYTPKSSLPNGCALGYHDSPVPNDNLAELITKMLINLLSKFSDIIPYTVLETLQGHISTAIITSNSLGSDHLPIVITLCNSSIPTPPKQDPLLKYRLPGADWSKFREILNDNIRNIPPVTKDNFLIIYSNFIVALTSAADDSIPLKNSAREKVPSPAWWDAECTAAIKERKKAETLFAADLSIERYLDFQRISARTKRLLSNKKKQGWRSFCESLSPRTPSTLVWRKIKAFRCSQSDNNVSSNSVSWLDDFVAKLAPPFVPSQDGIGKYSSSSSPSDRMSEPFSYEELCCALDHLQDSAPGLDGIPYSFLTQSPNSAKQLFLQILNEIYLSGKVPEEWKVQIVIPLLKANKDPADPNSHRPIALSCVPAKIMEHLIKNRLEWFVETFNKLSSTQFGFRKGMGTMDSLSVFTSDVRIAFSRGEHVVGVFLDVKAAYDNVDLPLLRQKMLNLSIPARTINIISNLLMGRSILVRCNGVLTSPYFVWKGLPQGSVLSPLLYSLYTADLDTSVNCFCKILQYADDIALYTSSKSVTEASNSLNSALYYLDTWLGDHGLSLSPDKSSVVVFTRKRAVPETNIQVNDHPIANQEKVKFLGIILDSKLTGIDHLNYVSQKAEKNINILRALSGVRWGSHPYSQKLLYNAIIRSHFDYGCFLLEPCSKLALSKLDKIQARCLRIITGAMKSSPTKALQVECLDPPYHLRRQYLADRFLSKTLQTSSHPLLPIIESLTQYVSTSPYWTHKVKPLLVNSFQKIQALPVSLFQNYRNPLFETDYDSLIFQPTVLLSLGIHKKQPNADSFFNRVIGENWSDYLIIFTDASRLSEGGPLPPGNSVFSGEAVALLEAILFAHSHKISKSLILTDSLSCLQDIVKRPFHAKDNFCITLLIKEILHKSHLESLDIVLAWIPGHCGIKGNETADMCAKEAIELGCDKYKKCFPRDILIRVPHAEATVQRLTDSVFSNLDIGGIIDSIDGAILLRIELNCVGCEIKDLKNVEEDELPKSVGSASMAEMEAAVMMQKKSEELENTPLNNITDTVVNMTGSAGGARGGGGAAAAAGAGGTQRPPDQGPPLKSESTRSRRRRERHWLETQASETDL
ncbi:hypothetical protein MSG28_016154 [Choristoneura fumiferana]|uniref:Uncharacterized protein n=1 Tax=Choristoneura fumiferana TaxID=7141 RepID=A0ACC0K684_CHOFU|nr:hypothetical protein MSG28_016154 [Choristoneura fumiferana]